MITPKYKGAEWLAAQFAAIAKMRGGAERQISEHGRRVADLLGELLFGLYHLNKTSLYKAEWHNNHYIQVTMRGELSTWDYNNLTRIVFLAHAFGMRVGIEGAANGYLRLRFINPEGASKHPTIDAAVERFYEEYPEVQA